MKTKIIVKVVLFMLLLSPFCSAQLSIEPAIQLRPVYNGIGIGEIGISNLLNYQLKSNFSVAAYTSIANQFFTVGDFGGNLNTTIERRIKWSQQFGLSYHIQGKKSSHALFLLGGFGFLSFKERLFNAELDLDKSYSTSSFQRQMGVLYRWNKKVNEKINFTLRTYLPLLLFEGLRADPLDWTLEFGVSIQLNKGKE